jgi:hypothetical protein
MQQRRSVSVAQQRGVRLHVSVHASPMWCRSPVSYGGVYAAQPGRSWESRGRRTLSRVPRAIVPAVLATAAEASVARR